MGRPGISFAAVAAAALASTAIPTPSRGGDEDEEEAPFRIRAEVEVLKREVRELRARVRELERALDVRASERALESRGHGAARGAEVSDDLGISLPGGPRGGTGSESVLKLPLLLVRAATGQDPARTVGDLTAFGVVGFLVPEPVWSEVARNHAHLRGAVPTKDELELALSVLRRIGPGATVPSVVPLEDNLGADGRAVRVVKVTVAGPAPEDPAAQPQMVRDFLLTGVRLSGRWLVAHLHPATEVERAGQLARDVVTSAVAYRAFRGRWPADLKALAADRRAIESSENLRRAGFRYPFASWLEAERFRKDDGYDWDGADLVSPFYRVRLDENGAAAVPKVSSWLGWLARPAARAPGLPVDLKSERGRVPSLAGGAEGGR